MPKHKSTLLVTALAFALSAACADDAASPDGGGGNAAPPDGGGGQACTPRDDAERPDRGSCEPLDSDYSPCADDAWPACISDDGHYHRIEDTISTIGRVAAFEEIAELLFNPETEPSSDAFLQARMIYQEDEGLDSRVVRRYDPHFLEAGAEAPDCAAEGVPAMEPDYCVGKARIQGVILDALNAGILGQQPRAQAARVEAGLLWFLYVSTFKESLSCTEKARDCDSSYAYYTGGESARGGVGLSRYVKEVAPHAHDRAWDGLLAQRCWRDLDSAEVASDLELRDRARQQTDRAILHGVAMVVRDRLASLGTADDAVRTYHWAFAQVLGSVLDREARQRSSDAADTLASELGKDADSIDTGAATAAIDAVFDCP